MLEIAIFLGKSRIEDEKTPCLYHLERMDVSGSPQRLPGKQIIMAFRVSAVVNTGGLWPLAIPITLQQDRRTNYVFYL